MKTEKVILGFIALILLFVWLLAGIGGTAYLFYYGETFFGVMNILMAIIAGLQLVPLVREAMR